jgi:hypothetical protein
MNMTTIGQLCEDSHRISREKGWLDDPRPFDEITALIHSELSEALEDYRNNKGVNEAYYQVKLKVGSTGMVVEKEISAAELLEVQKSDGKYGRGDNLVGAKPCGIPIEFADFLIRIAQYCGTNGWDLEGVVHGVAASLEGETLKPRSFGETLALLHADISCAYLASINIVPPGMPSKPLHYFAMAWLTTFSFAAKNGIDLWAAIKEKQAYNETRPHRHGGKKI